MGLKKGDMLDEHKRHPDSCGLVVKVMGGGAGFEKVVCCDNELTEEDLVTDIGSRAGRKKGTVAPSLVIDEKKLYPDSCGLRVMIIDGGSGFREIRCCGHSLTVNSVQEMKFGLMRGPLPEEPGPETGPVGHA